MKRRMALAAALLIAALGALGMAAAAAPNEPEPMELPTVVLPRNTPQDAAQTQERIFIVTAYCPCEKCCGAYASGYTATGAKATQGVTIAADPDVLPMGTGIELDGHIYTVQDTGGAIAGNRLDLYFDSHEDALRWGVQEKIVRWSA